jgi:gamma-tubulin complex component 4
MLQDVLLGLLGFAGDVIVESTSDSSGSSILEVKPGFDLLSSSEKDQLNKVVPLGSLYRFLKTFCERYEVQWGSSSVDSEEGFQSYLAALCMGINDYLSEYIADVTALEKRLHSEGPFPVTYLLTSLHKYILTMPILRSVCVDINQKRLRGGQIIDYLTAFKSGMPVVAAAIRRLQRRVRVVFLKQCMAWMLYGELHDPGGEYLIVRRGSNGSVSSS